MQAGVEALPRRIKSDIVVWEKGCVEAEWFPNLTVTTGHLLVVSHSHIATAHIEKLQDFLTHFSLPWC